MAAWTWDAVAKQFVSPSGKPLSQSATTQLRNRFAAARSDIARSLAEQLNAGTITQAEFATAFEQFIADTITASYMVGRGGANALQSADETAILDMINDQLGFGNDFVKSLGDLSADQIANQASLYGDAAVKAFEQGKGASWGVQLPGYPGDWETSCVADSFARVLTDRGMVPIAHVAVGDLVMTHMGRFRTVSATIRTLARDRPYADISVASGRSVRFTTDHKLLSPHGWTPVDGIMQWQLPVYSIEEADVENGNVPGLRGRNRPSGDSMCTVFERSISESAMGESRDSRADDIGDSDGGGAEANSIRGHHSGAHELAEEDGRTPVYALLGRGPKALHLPESVGLDSGAWTNPGWPSDPPLQRRQDGRFNQQPSVLAGSEARPTAHVVAEFDDVGSSWSRPDRQTMANMRAMREGIPGEASNEPGATESILLARVSNRVNANDPDLSDVRAGVCGWTGSWQAANLLQSRVLPEGKVDPDYDDDVQAMRGRIHGEIGAWQTPNVLQSGMLPSGTILYDLTVEDDHSFVVEGIVAHNCKAGCRCVWSIVEQNGETSYRWITASDSAVCPECAQRGIDWNPWVPS